jgi:multicomponent K+:H+ antiporter subunit F
MNAALVSAQVLVGLAMVFTAYRLLRGPRAQDRVLALDTLYVNALILMITIGMRTGSSFYFEAALIIGMLGFVATVALAKFLLRGEVIE